MQHNKGKNKQVSKVIEEISENETNVLIMRMAERMSQDSDGAQ